MPLRFALSVALILLAASLSPAWGQTDDVRRQAPGTSASPPPFQPEFQFSFGAPARWPGGLLRWRYNSSSAPPGALVPILQDPAVVVQKLAAAASKWSASCGIRFLYDGATTAAPTQPTDPAPDNVNVVGWRQLTPGTVGLTYTWNDSPPNQSVLVDADVLFNWQYITSYEQLDRTASHEWGHAIGIGHSNLSGALMSGLPDSPYSYVTDPQPDDVRACRCLYGAAAGQSAAYACSLPAYVDFGVQTVGQMSGARSVDVVNDASATLPLTVGGSSTTSSEFFVTGGTCGASPLAPGAGCKVTLAARPVVAGTRTAELQIATSEGQYRVPLTMDGYAPPTPPSVNVQGLWWASPAGSESGWGLNLAHQGDTIYATWFTYDTSGRGWWLVMTANKTAPNTYSGPLLQTRGPAFDAVPWSPLAVANTPVGTGTLAFTDASNGTFTYTVGGVTQTKAITKEVFGALPVCTWGGLSDLTLATNYQDLWWAAPAATESGWGVNLNHQGDKIFATWFTYDLDGTPMWLVATALRTDVNTFAGDLYRTTGPAWSAPLFDPAQVKKDPVGSLTLTFADGNHATFAYSVKLPGMTVASVQAKAITREVFAAPGTACK